jgi:hypothetical protein
MINESAMIAEIAKKIRVDYFDFIRSNPSFGVLNLDKFKFEDAIKRAKTIERGFIDEFIYEKEKKKNPFAIWHIGVTGDKAKCAFTKTLVEKVKCAFKFITCPDAWKVMDSWEAMYNFIGSDEYERSKEAKCAFVTKEAVVAKVQEVIAYDVIYPPLDRWYLRENGTPLPPWQTIKDGESMWEYSGSSVNQMVLNRALNDTSKPPIDIEQEIELLHSGTLQAHVEMMINARPAYPHTIKTLEDFLEKICSGVLERELEQTLKKMEDEESTMTDPALQDKTMRKWLMYNQATNFSMKDEHADFTHSLSRTIGMTKVQANESMKRVTERQS